MKTSVVMLFPLSVNVEKLKPFAIGDAKHATQRAFNQLHELPSLIDSPDFLDV